MNSMLPIAAAARLGLPMVDVDGMGRAFPETADGHVHHRRRVGQRPWLFIDEKGNMRSLWRPSTTSGSRTSAAPAVTAMRRQRDVSTEYVMDGTRRCKRVRRARHRHAQPRNWAVRSAACKNCPGDHAARNTSSTFTGGFRLFKGKICRRAARDPRRRSTSARCVLEGIGEDTGGHAEVDFQNESLVVRRWTAKFLPPTPDLICLVDTETFTPVPTDALKYGKRVLVVGLPCYHLWRTEKGIELVGPRYFGLNTDYVPARREM